MTDPILLFLPILMEIHPTVTLYELINDMIADLKKINNDQIMYLYNIGDVL